MTIEQATQDTAAGYARQAVGYKPLLFSAAYQMTRNGTQLRGWLSRILANTFINSYHSRRRRPEVLGLDVDDRQFDAPVNASGPGRDPAEEVLAGMVDEKLQSALRSLPPPHRRVVLLADVEGYSYKEIAQITGSPVGTVMSRLHRGRQALKSALSDYRPTPASSADTSHRGARYPGRGRSRRHRGARLEAASRTEVAAPCAMFFSDTPVCPEGSKEAGGAAR